LQVQALTTRYPANGQWLRRFTVDEYQRLVTHGFFARDERYELLEGLIVQKMSRDPYHDACLAESADLLRSQLPAGWHVRNQSSVVTTDSQPEPDLLVVRGRPSDYAARHPGAADAALVVEVSNSSLADDRTWKGAVYARAGFAVYWIVNLVDRRVEVYTDPSGPDPAPAYRRREEFHPGQTVPLMIDGVALPAVPVDQMLLVNPAP
jgi:Uma2 family endonuclease